MNTALKYPLELPDAYSDHGYWMMTDVRDEIEKLGLSDDPKVKELDRRLLMNLKSTDRTHTWKRKDRTGGGGTLMR
ncbi:MAG: hypothetical protein Q9N34_01285 [Aquificota bacterium]|nr:hypothetical protein [Aquificota bacterium]